MRMETFFFILKCHHKWKKVEMIFYRLEIMDLGFQINTLLNFHNVVRSRTQERRDDDFKSVFEDENSKKSKNRAKVLCIMML